MNSSDARLLLELSRAKTLQELVDLGCQLLGNPIFIDDMYRNILAYSQNVVVDDPLWQQNIVENVHDESSQSRIASKGLYKKSMDTHHPVLLTDLDTVNRYGMTLTNYGVPIGNAIVAAHLKDFEEGDETLFELFCHYATELLINSRFSTRKSQPLAVNTLIRLLDGQSMSRDAVESKLGSFVIENQDRHAFLIVLSDETGDALSCASLVVEALSMVPGTIAFSYQHYILALVSVTRKQFDLQYQQTIDILKQYNLYAGVSKHIHDIMELSLCYTQAVTALKMANLTEDKRFYYYNDVAVFDMLNLISKQVNLLDYCDEGLMILYKYDREHENNLMKTLQVYLESCLQYEATAKALFVHKNTVRYRISKCQKILETDFTDGDKIFQYILSLKILEFLQYF